MIRVSIGLEWSITAPQGNALGMKVVDLLVKVEEHGSLAQACTVCGVSYRYAWTLIREAEQVLGQPVLTMSRGRGSALTVLGARLVWAHRRIQARLTPLLDSLASEVGAEIERVVSPQPAQLRIHASHGFAVQLLHVALNREGVAHELKYCGTAEALESLAQGECDVAGFHVPVGEFAPAVIEHLGPALDDPELRVIRLATRRQGLMTPPGNPKKIYGVEDLARADVRFINRQPGSGTRFLVDLMLKGKGLVPSEVRGYEQYEYTHAAVAAFVASGMADVGMGVEPPARQFKLEFIPLQQESYFLLCRAATLGAPNLLQFLEVLRSPAFQREVNGLPGYATDRMGDVETVGEALPLFEAWQQRLGASEPTAGKHPAGPRQ